MGKTAKVKLAESSNLHDPVLTATMLPLDTLVLASEVEGYKGSLRRAPDNAESFAALKASIDRVGLLVPIIYEKTKYGNVVLAGNRRVRALRELSNGAATGVPAVNRAAYPSGSLLEIAYATNVALPMHPVDQHEVIGSVIRDGMTEADAAAHFALTRRQVAQVMAIGDLCPEVREAWRTGAIDSAAATAFTLCPDPKEQAKVLATLKKQGRVDRWAVRQRFVGNQHEAGRLVEFVGVAELKAAGIGVNNDLFGTDHTIEAGKMPALKRMATEKLEAACNQLVADGWAWAVPADSAAERYSYGRLESKGSKPTPEEAQRISEMEGDEDAFYDQLTELRQRINARGYTAEQRAKSGCFVSIGTDGTLGIEYGRIKPQQVRSEKAKTVKATKDKARKAGEPASISNALMQRLSEQLTTASATVIAGEPGLALAFLCAGFATRGHGPVCVSENGLAFRRSPDHKMVEFESALKVALKETLNSKIGRLAWIAAAALNMQTFTAENPPLKDKAIRAACEALPSKKFNKALVDAFEAENYYESVSKNVVLEAIAECDDKASKELASASKKETVVYALAHVPAGWLPPQLRVSGYDGPGAKSKRK